MPDILGLDISRWQGRISAETAARQYAAGIRFVGIKATQGGSYKDPYFEPNLEAYKGSGILVFPYHFTTNDNPIQQRDNFLGVLTQYDYRWQLPPALDCEAFTALAIGDEPMPLRELRHLVSSPVRRELGPMPSPVRLLRATSKYERLFALTVRALFGLSYPNESYVWNLGKEVSTWMQGQVDISRFTWPVIYTNSSSGNTIFKTARYNWSEWPLWVANWRTSKPYLPKQWQAAGKYIIWQYDVTKGQDVGIDGDVDRDRWGNLCEFPSGTPEPEPPEPEPEPPAWYDVTLTGSDGSRLAGRVNRE